MDLLKLGFLSIQIWDILDIAIVSVVIYYGMLLLRGTRATQMVVGIVSLLLVYLLATWAQLNAIVWLISLVGKVGIIALVIVFQPELRGGLAKIGNYGLSGFYHRKRGALNTVEEVSKAAIDLSSRGLGGLIVIEQEMGLKDYRESGRHLQCRVDSEVLVSLFFSNAPLHDGAVIIQGENIISAGVVLPLIKDSAYDYLVGMRHRAALGLSAETDAIIIVISEETGGISVVQNSHLQPNVPKDKVKEVLSQMVS